MANTDMDASRPRSASFDFENDSIVRQLVHLIRSYRAAIVLWLSGIFLAVAIVVIAVFLLAPTQQITSQPFRLDFEGASRGQYPSGMKFTPSDITNTPVLLRVYTENNLARYCTFVDFTRAVFVSESNRAAEQLAREYAARMSDPRISSIDRERYETEYRLKREGLDKDQYSINYVNSSATAKLPPAVIRKVLSNLLTVWADDAMVEKKVLEYHVPTLSQNILDRGAIGEGASDFVIFLSVLRTKAVTLLENCNALQTIPGVEVVRARHDHMSLEELRLHLGDLIRFRIEPLIKEVCARGLVSPSATMIRLEAQLSYDERLLRAAQQSETAVRDAFAAYDQEQSRRPSSDLVPRSAGDKNGETVMPQINDSFLDRIVQLSKGSEDRAYRQLVVKELKDAALGTIGPSSAVAYDHELIDSVKAARSGSVDSVTEERLRKEIDAIYSDLQATVTSLNEIHQTASRQLNPVTQLFTFTSVPMVTVEAAISPVRLFLFGALVFLLSIPFVIIGCFVHERVEVERTAEEDAALDGGAAA